jgi:hypothetical protein
MWVKAESYGGRHYVCAETGLLVTKDSSGHVYIKTPGVEEDEYPNPAGQALWEAIEEEYRRVEREKIATENRAVASFHMGTGGPSPVRSTHCALCSAPACLETAYLWRNIYMVGWVCNSCRGTTAESDAVDAEEKRLKSDEERRRALYSNEVRDTLLRKEGR